MSEARMFVCGDIHGCVDELMTKLSVLGFNQMTDTLYALVGRPVARRRDDGRTLEVTRLCTDGSKNVCSFLYGAAARAAFALGYSRIGTYILKREPGTSLAAAGWKLIGETPGRSWSVPSRPRDDKHPIEPKLLFEAKRKAA